MRRIDVFDSDIPIIKRIDGRVVSGQDNLDEFIKSTKPKKKSKSKLELEKIVRKKTYHAKCSVCNRRLKNLYVTTQGHMGANCFFRELGHPIPRKRAKWLDLPEESFISMSKHFIKVVKNLTEDQIVEIVKNWYRSMNNVKYIILKKSYEIWVRRGNPPNRLDKINLIFRSNAFAPIIRYPTYVFKNMKATSVFSEFWLKERFIVKNKLIYGDKEYLENVLNYIKKEISNLNAYQKKLINEYKEESKTIRQILNTF